MKKGETMLYRVLGWIVGFPLYLIGKLTNNYVVAALIFILVVRLLYLIFQAFSVNAKNRATIATKYIRILKKEYAGREPKIYEEKALAVYDATRSSPITKVVLTVVLLFMFSSMFVVFKNPLTYFYGVDNKEALIETAKTIEEYKNGANEMQVVLAIKEHPEVFKDFDVARISDSDINIFGLNMLKPASRKNLTFLVPVFLILLMMFNATKSVIIKVIHKKLTIKDFVPAAFMFFVSSTLSLSAFILPISYFIALIISHMVSMISGPIINRSTMKKHGLEYKEMTKKCEEITYSKPQEVESN